MLVYITTVLLLTSVLGQDVICKNDGFASVGGACYRYNSALMSEPQARANCESWNGTLAKFTSLDSLREVALKLDVSSRFFWIDAQEDVQEKGIQWAALVSLEQEFIWLYPYSCSEAFSSLCIEVYDPTLTTTTTIITGDIPNIGDSNVTMTTPKACLRDNYFSVNDVCYRLSTESVLWNDANTHCNSLNGTLASFYSVQQGINVLTQLMLFNKVIFVNIYNNNISNFAKLVRSSDDCSTYNYGQYHPMDAYLQVLCIEEPPITTTVETITQKPISEPTSPTTTELTAVSESTTTQEPTTVSESPTTQEPTIAPESTSTQEPTAVSESPTTQEPTTASESTTTQESTTASESPTTQEPTTASESTTTKEPTAVSESPTTTKPTTVSESNTSPELTPTPETTTKTKSTTTQKSINILEPTTRTKSTDRNDEKTTPKKTTTPKQTTISRTTKKLKTTPGPIPTIRPKLNSGSESNESRDSSERPKSKCKPKSNCKAEMKGRKNSNIRFPLNISSKPTTTIKSKTHLKKQQKNIKIK